MRYQRSICSWEDNPDMEMQLSGEFSEYLFSVGFWSSVNASCGTIFDQFETDRATVPVLRVISRNLVKVRKVLEKSPPSFQFVRGWTGERQPIGVTASRDGFLKELDAFRQFIDNSIERMHLIEFHL